MNENFKKAMEFVFLHEGGYVPENSCDPGGETKFGISKKSYPSLDIRNLTKDMAEAIYFKDFWLKSQCDKIKWPGDIIVFDTAINLGLILARYFHIKSKNDWSAYLNFRKSYYQNLAIKRPEMGKFLKGWLRRVSELRTEAGLE